MTVNHFDTAVDQDGKIYIYQRIKEYDKNHRENDMSSNNEGRICAIEGKERFFKAKLSNSCNFKITEV